MSNCTCGATRCALDTHDDRHGTVNGYANQHCLCGLCKSAGAAWRLANRDRIQRQRAEYRQVHNERINAQQRAEYRDNQSRREQRKASSRARYRSDPVERNIERRMRVYKLSRDEVVALLDSPCAGCFEKVTGRWAHIDHNHETGKVRGLLCHNCNLVLRGSVTSTILRRLADYLERD